MNNYVDMWIIIIFLFFTKEFISEYRRIPVGLVYILKGVFWIERCFKV